MTRTFGPVCGRVTAATLILWKPGEEGRRCVRKSAMNWTGDGDQLIGIHAMLGFLLVLSLWAIAAIAARSGVSIGLVALAVAYGLAAPILAGPQDRLVAAAGTGRSRCCTSL